MRNFNKNFISFIIIKNDNLRFIIRTLFRKKNYDNISEYEDIKDVIHSFLC